MPARIEKWQAALLVAGIPLQFVLFHYVHNIDEVPLAQIGRPLVLLTAVSLGLFLLARLLLGGGSLASVFSSAFVLLFLNDGTLRALVRAFFRLAHAPALGMALQAYALPALLVALSVWVLWARRETGSRVKPALKVMSVAVAVLLILCASQWAQAAMRKPTVVADAALPVEHAGSRTLPDIFYVVTDAYARSDVLREHFGWDNSGFLNFLRAKGFYVADRSCSNYAQTYLSLASSLNGIYLNDKVGAKAQEGDDRRMLADLIQRNALMRKLKELGYETVCIASGTPITELRHADRRIEPQGFSLSDFENLLLNHTPVIPVLRLFPREWSHAQFTWHRRRVLFALSALENMRPGAKPLFVFAHIMSPHPPFVLDGQGAALHPQGRYDGWGMDGIKQKEEYVKQYREQAAYVSSRLQTAVEKIIEGRPVQPLIVLQGDHGPGFWYDLYRGTDLDAAFYRERFSILNALLLPESCRKLLYPEISPVNTLRVIFNGCFGGDGKPLPDKSYFSPWVHPYRLRDVTEILAAQTKS